MSCCRRRRAYSPARWPWHRRTRRQRSAGSPRVSRRLKDEPDPATAIGVDVVRGNLLRRAVDDDVGLSKEVVEGSRDGRAGSVHRFGIGGRGAEQSETVVRCNAWSPVGLDVRDPGQCHVMSTCRATASATRLPITPYPLTATRMFVSEVIYGATLALEVALHPFN